MVTHLHYSNWKVEYEYILKGLKKKKILMFFSGGKDSSFLLDYLIRAGKEFGFSFETHAGAFPIHRYTKSERKRLGAYWAGRGVDILWHEFSEGDEQLRRSDNPCLSCQKIRKEVLQKLVASEEDLTKLMMVVSYSLWDLVSYSIEHILSDIFTNSDKTEGSEMSKRFLETSQRFYPILEMKEGYTIFRPLVRYDTRTILREIQKIGMPILSIPCEFKDHRPKRVLEKYYENMDLDFDYNRVFQFTKECLNLPDSSKFSSIEKEKYLKEIF